MTNKEDQALIDEIKSIMAELFQDDIFPMAKTITILTPKTGKENYDREQ